MYRETAFAKQMKDKLKDNLFITRHNIEVVKENEQEFDFYITKNEKRMIRFDLEYDQKVVYIENISTKITNESSYVMDMIERVLHALEHLEDETLVEAITVYRFLNLYTNLNVAVKKEEMEHFFKKNGFDKAAEIEEEVWTRFMNNPNSVNENWIKFIKKSRFERLVYLFRTIRDTLHGIQERDRQFSYTKNTNFYIDQIDFHYHLTKGNIEIQLRSDEKVEIRHNGEKHKRFVLLELNQEELMHVIKSIVLKDEYIKEERKTEEAKTEIKQEEKPRVEPAVSFEEKRTAYSLRSTTKIQEVGILSDLQLSSETKQKIQATLENKYSAFFVEEELVSSKKGFTQPLKNGFYSVIPVGEHLVAILKKTIDENFSIYHRNQKELVAHKLKQVLEQEAEEIVHEFKKMFEK